MYIANSLFPLIRPANEAEIMDVVFEREMGFFTVLLVFSISNITTITPQKKKRKCLDYRKKFLTAYGLTSDNNPQKKWKKIENLQLVLFALTGIITALKKNAICASTLARFSVSWWYYYLIRSLAVRTALSFDGSFSRNCPRDALSPLENVGSI